MVRFYFYDCNKNRTFYISSYLNVLIQTLLFTPEFRGMSNKNILDLK